MTTRTITTAQAAPVGEEQIVDLIVALMHQADAAGVDGGGYYAAKQATQKYGAAADAVNLRAFIDTVRQEVPSAVSMVLGTGDEAGYGFGVCSLLAADGSEIGTPDAIEEAAWEHLKNITWGGVVGEDKHGYATVPLVS